MNANLPNEQQSLQQRMEIAVRRSFEAIARLKEENAALRKENELLKAAQRHNTSDLNSSTHETVEPSSSTSQPKPSSRSNAVSEKPQQANTFVDSWVGGLLKPDNNEETAATVELDLTIQSSDKNQSGSVNDDESVTITASSQSAAKQRKRQRSDDTGSSEIVPNVKRRSRANDKVDVHDVPDDASIDSGAQYQSLVLVKELGKQKKVAVISSPQSQSDHSVSTLNATSNTTNVLLFLQQLSIDNFHFIAQSLVKPAVDATVKAMELYIEQVVSRVNGRALSFSEEEKKFSFHPSVLKQMDLLSNVVISMATRTCEFSQALHILQQVFSSLLTRLRRSISFLIYSLLQGQSQGMLLHDVTIDVSTTDKIETSEGGLGESEIMPQSIKFTLEDTHSRNQPNFEMDTISTHNSSKAPHVHQQVDNVITPKEQQDQLRSLFSFMDHESDDERSQHYSHDPHIVLDDSNGQKVTPSSSSNDNGVMTKDNSVQSTAPSYFDKFATNAINLFFVLSTLFRMGQDDLLDQMIEQVALVSVNVSCGISLLIAMSYLVYDQRFSIKAFISQRLRARLCAMLALHLAKYRNRCDDRNVTDQMIGGELMNYFLNVYDQLVQNEQISIEQPMNLQRIIQESWQLQQQELQLRQSGSFHDIYYEIISRQLFRKEGLLKGLSMIENGNDEQNSFQLLGLPNLHELLPKLQTNLDLWASSLYPSFTNSNCNDGSGSRKLPSSLSAMLVGDHLLVTSLQSSCFSNSQRILSDGLRVSDETQLVNSFEFHWRNVLLENISYVSLQEQHTVADGSLLTKATDSELLLSMQLHDIHFTLHQLSNCLSSVFRTELVAKSGGRWNLGFAENGISLVSKMKERIQRLKMKLGMVRKPFRIMKQSKSGVNTPSCALAWISYSSNAPISLLRECCEICDYSCLMASEHYRTHYTDLFRGQNGDRQVMVPQSSEEKQLSDQEKHWDLVRRGSLELASITTLIFVEYIIMMIAFSVRGLLMILEQILKKSRGYEIITPILSIIDLIHQISEVIPSQHFAMCTAEVRCALLNCQRHIVRHLSSPPIPQSIRVFLRLQRKFTLPAFLINLDRRQDRWRRMQLMAEQCSICLFRTEAVDARNLFATFDENNNHLQPSTNCTTVIPVEDVSLTWNPALYYKFDRRVKGSDARMNKKGQRNVRDIAMTRSERACAASHLVVWRRIQRWRYKQNLCASPPLDLVPDSQHHDSTMSLLEQQPQYSFSHAMRSWTKVVHDRIAKSHERKKAKKNLDSLQSNSNRDDNNHQHLFQIIDRAFDWYMILEDDAVIELSRRQILKLELDQIMSKLPEHIDILYLGGYVPVKSNAFKGEKVKKIFYFANYILDLCGYILRGRAINILLENLPITGPVDKFLGELMFNETLVGAALLHGGTNEKKLVEEFDKLHDSEVISSIEVTTGIVG